MPAPRQGFSSELPAQVTVASEPATAAGILSAASLIPAICQSCSFLFTLQITVPQSIRQSWDKHKGSMLCSQGVNKDSYLILETLPTEYDSRVKAMEVDERPTEQYSDIGGLDKQIQEVREARLLSTAMPAFLLFIYLTRVYSLTVGKKTKPNQRHCQMLVA